jgi:hypothetical protein
MGASTDLKREKKGAVQRCLHFALEMDDCKLFRKRKQKLLLIGKNYILWTKKR